MKSHKIIYGFIALVLASCQGKVENKNNDKADGISHDSVATLVDSIPSADSISINKDSVSRDSVVMADSMPIPRIVPRELIEQTLQFDDTFIVRKTLKNHPPVKGIYVSGPIAGHSRFKELLEMVETTELNAMVIDVKNDNGNVTYNMEHKLVNEFKANIRYIRGIRSFLDNLHSKNIYVIGRVVAFRDPLLAKKNPDWCVHRKDGSIYYDRAGLAWVNPYNREVWKYLVSIGKRAAADGFDEIQFDYIRFSTEVKDSEVNYGYGSDTMSKQQVITEFVKYSAEEFGKCGIAFSADVFGTVIDNDVDTRLVGQNYADMGKYVSTISPMIYPSHYGPKVFGIPIPNNAPYQTILGSMKLSKKVLDSLDRKPNVRAWLQDFSAPWVAGARPYTAADVRAQIDAIYDAGYDEWLLWNASVRYRKEALIRVGDTVPAYKKYKSAAPQKPVSSTTDSVNNQKKSDIVAKDSIVAAPSNIKKDSISD